MISLKKAKNIKKNPKNISLLAFEFKEIIIIILSVFSNVT
jgi:hypothetical protein